jgi:hypothetical protein
MTYVMKRDENGTIIYNATTGYADREQAYLGVGVPPTLLGVNNNFRYKNLSLAVDIDSKLGAIGYSNLLQYASRFGHTKWTLEGRENGLTLTGIDQAGNPYTTLWKVEDLDTYYDVASREYPGLFTFSTDFVKLRRIVLRYELPSKIIKPLRIERASIALTGFNMLILYQDKKVKDNGIDPEIQETVGNAQGTAGVSTPPTRNFGFNLNIRF